jgi:carboxypeptidase C (cathepsin A)
MHMGAVGPKKALLNDDGSLPPAPFRLVDNENSILDITDLVFIDPVSTGFSRPAPGEDPKQFHGVEGDLASVGDFIRLWTTRNERWSSPKFLAGESYGTTRAAGLSDYLLQNYGMYLNGITLVSSILNFGTADFDRGNDLPYITFLPSYTAVAWYHKKLPPDLQADRDKAVQEARRFAATDYTLALMKGDKISPDERTHIAQQLARFTGLSVDYVERANLRIHMQRFAKELLRDEHRTVGRYDGRMEGEDYDAAGETPEYDPSYSVVLGPFAGVFNDYVRSDLKWESDLPYEILTGKVQPWNYAPFENRYINMAERLRQAITQNPDLHVMVCNGFYDMATPFFATEYTFNHMGLDSKLTGNVSLTYYEGGHMFYTNKPAAAELRKNLVDFYGRVVGR